MTTPILVTHLCSLLLETWESACTFLSRLKKGTPNNNSILYKICCIIPQNGRYGKKHTYLKTRMWSKLPAVQAGRDTQMEYWQVTVISWWWHQKEVSWWSKAQALGSGYWNSFLVIVTEMMYSVLAYNPNWAGSHSSLRTCFYYVGITDIKGWDLGKLIYGIKLPRYHIPV